MAALDPVLTSAGYLLLKAGHYMTQEFEAALAALELTGREFLVLSFVAPEGQLPQQELTERLGLDPTIIVALVDALEERRLLTRSRDATDRRRNVLALTARRPTPPQPGRRRRRQRRGGVPRAPHAQAAQGAAGTPASDDGATAALARRHVIRRPGAGLL